MSELSISGEQLFKDFSFNILDVIVERSGKEITNVKGLFNADEGGRYWGFLYSCDVKTGDCIRNLSTSFKVKYVEISTYHGKPTLLKAYY